MLRIQELDDLFRSRHVVSAANRLADFVNEFTSNSDWKKDVMVFCMKADHIEDSWKRKRIREMDEYLDLITTLVYDMLDTKEAVVDYLKQSKAAA